MSIKKRSNDDNSDDTASACFSGSPEPPKPLQVTTTSCSRDDLDEEVGKYLMRAWTERTGHNGQIDIAFDNVHDQPFFVGAVAEIATTEEEVQRDRQRLHGNATPPGSALGEKFHTHVVLFWLPDLTISFALDEAHTKPKSVRVALLSGDDFVDEVLNFLRPLGMDHPSLWTAELDDGVGRFLARRLQITNNIKNPRMATRMMRAKFLKHIGPEIGIRDDPDGDVIRWAPGYEP